MFYINLSGALLPGGCHMRTTRHFVYAPSATMSEPQVSDFSNIIPIEVNVNYIQLSKENLCARN